MHPPDKYTGGCIHHGMNTPPGCASGGECIHPVMNAPPRQSSAVGGVFIPG